MKDVNFSLDINMLIVNITGQNQSGRSDRSF